MPATPEACLMRLADKISYIPQDMIDGIKEGLVRDEDGNIVDYIDKDYENVLLKLGITKEEIDEANDRKEFTPIQDKLKTIFINDVIKNSSRRRIKMSNETMTLMGELLTLNNEKAVNYVVLKEDQLTYPKAIRSLINIYKDIINKEDLLNKKPSKELIEKYKNTPHMQFITYICNMNDDEMQFFKEIAEKSTLESTKIELDTARVCVQRGDKYNKKEELGLDYSSKNSRIREYIKYYESQLSKCKLFYYSTTDLENETQKILSHLKEGNGKPNNLNMEGRTAILISAKFISLLNDIEFMDLIKSEGIISDEQYMSLTRKYKDIKDLPGEAYISKTWKLIAQAQKQIARNDIVII